MPYAPRGYCREHCTPPCKNKATHQGRCRDHYLARQRIFDARRPGGAARGSTREWRDFSRAYLHKHPRCECPEHMAMPYWARPIATDVNHLGEASRTSDDRYDESKLMAMAHECHSRWTAKHQPGGWNKRTPVDGAGGGLGAT